MWKKAYQIIKETVLRFMDNGGSLLSASLAFYSILSIAPLALIAVSLAGLIFGEDAATSQFRNSLARYLGAGSANTVADLVTKLHDLESGTHATLIGFVLLLFAAARLFGQVQDAINQLWHIRTEFKDIKVGVLTTVYKKLIAFGMVFLLGALLSSVIIASTAAAAAKQLLGPRLPGSELLWSLGPVGTTFVVVSVMFTMMYRMMPDAHVAWRDAASGALLAALLFTLAEWPLGFYLSHQGVESAYGAAGSLVVVLLWVYYASHIFFLGAQFTHVFADFSGRGLQPDAMAVLVKQVPVTEPEPAEK